MEARLPVSVTLSVAVHAGGLAGWLYLNHASPKSQLRMISNVELLVSAPPQSVRAPLPPSTWNFLKLALPTVPKPRVIEVKAPEESRHRTLQEAKPLEDRGRLQKAKTLDAQPLDMGRKRVELAGLGAQLTERRAPRAPADLPKLEEVGTRRASKPALEMAALAEERAGRLGPQGAGLAAAALDTRSGRQPQAMALPAEEAAPARRGTLSRLASALTSEPLAEKTGPLPAGLGPAGALDPSALASQRQVAALGGQKKSVEIEGPLSKRKVAHYELPAFPAWAAAQGIQEAQVRVRFTVSPAGEVLPGMRVEHTSGYRALDRLAMEALQRWCFEPLPADAGNQWGIITFRFVLE